MSRWLLTSSVSTVKITGFSVGVFTRYAGSCLALRGSLGIGS